MPPPDHNRPADPTTVFLAKLIRMVERTPFEPFTIRMSDGRALFVPTKDHITITRLLREVIFETDSPVAIHDINPLHVVSLERTAA